MSTTTKFIDFLREWHDDVSKKIPRDAESAKEKVALHTKEKKDDLVYTGHHSQVHSFTSLSQKEDGKTGHVAYTHDSKTGKTEKHTLTHGDDYDSPEDVAKKHDHQLKSLHPILRKKIKKAYRDMYYDPS